MWKYIVLVIFTVTVMVDGEADKDIGRKLYERIAEKPVYYQVDKVCRQRPLELVFIIDASASIWWQNFTKAKNFVENFIGQYEIGEDKVRIGLVTYGSFVYFMDVIRLPKYTDLRTLQHAVQKLPYRAGHSTRTGNAIKYVRTSLFAESRPDVRKVAVVMTDGNSRFPARTAKQAYIARYGDIEMYCIGVSDQVSHKELVSIAGDESNVFYVTKYSELEKVKGRLAMKTCTQVARTTTTTTTTTTTPAPTTTTEPTTTTTPTTTTPKPTTTPAPTTTTKKQASLSVTTKITTSTAKPTEIPITSPTSPEIDETDTTDTADKTTLTDAADKATLTETADKATLTETTDKATLTDTADKATLTETAASKIVTARKSKKDGVLVIDIQIQSDQEEMGSVTATLPVTETETGKTEQDYIDTSNSTDGIEAATDVEKSKAKRKGTEKSTLKGRKSKSTKVDLKISGARRQSTEEATTTSPPKMSSAISGKVTLKKLSKRKGKGNRKNQNDSPQNDEACGSQNPADVYFVFDPAALGSTKTDWVARFIRRAINTGDMDHMQFGILSGSCPIDAGFNLDRYDTIEGIEKHLAKLTTPRIPGLMKDLITNGFSAERGGRPDCRNVTVLFVGSRLKDASKIVKAARKARDSGIELYFVNVGDATERLMNRLAQFGKRLDHSKSLMLQVSQFLSGLCLM